MKHLSRVLILGLGASLVACQSSTRYAWGSYEESVYNVTVNAGEVDLAAEIAQIQESLQRAEESHRLIPPGLHAHLGLLYSLSGDTANAAAAFRAEKALYPESATFIDGTLSRANL